jgi:hypothetical protein
MQHLLKLMFMPLVVTLATFIACTKNDTSVAEDAVDQALYSVQERGGMGRFGCYELQFPVTIELPDSSTATVNSFDEMKQTLRDFFEENGTTEHPHHGHGFRPFINFVFPITVVNADGELITVDDEQELRELRAACPGTFGNHTHHGHGNHGLSCFEITFPVTIAFPDSTTAEANSRQEMMQLIRTWKQANPGVQGRPHMTFPLTVKMTEDGSLVTVNSREELRDLKENCE